MDTQRSREKVRTAAATVWRHPWRSALVLVALALIALVLLWDWNWFKGPVERQVEARTGRSFDIGGNLDVDLDWRAPTIRADRLRFGNASWSKQPLMASADRAEFSIRLWPLLRRQVRIPDLKLTRPVLHLEMGPQRIGNWKFGKDTGPTQAQFAKLWIDAGRITFLDAAKRTDLGADVASVENAGDGASAIQVAGGGRWEGNRFSMNGRAESPLALRDRQRPYRIDVRGSAGATHAHARGTLTDPVLLRDFDLQLALSGQDMADLYPLIGVVTPNTPPYHLDGRLTREIVDARKRVWHYDNFHGTVGDSD
ncbi:MAG TPA: AsmA family protein, partial [Lysobacter sp.]